MSSKGSLTQRQKYERLAVAVRSRRDWMGWTQLDVHAKGGPSNSTLTQIEAAREPLPSPSTLRKLDHGLDWPAGMAKRLLESDETDDELEAWGREAEEARGPVKMSILPSGLRPETPPMSGAQLSSLYGQVVVFTESVRKTDPALADRAVSLMFQAATLFADALEVVEGRRTPSAREVADRARVELQLAEDYAAAHDEKHDIEDEQGHDEHP